MKFVGDPLQNPKLPTSFKESNLWGCSLSGSDMTVIASLPRLQILNLQGITMVVLVGFSCLKHLSIDSCGVLITGVTTAPIFGCWKCFTAPFLKTKMPCMLESLSRTPETEHDLSYTTLSLSKSKGSNCYDYSPETCLLLDFWLLQLWFSYYV